MPVTVSRVLAANVLEPNPADSRDWLTAVVPSSLVVPSSAPNWNRPRSPASPSAGGVGVWLTVMSVPTP